MRLIDADALLEKVWNADTRCGYVQVVDRGDIEDAPTIEPEPKWIPCSERLPKYGEPVLWCNEKGSVFTTAITFVNERGDFAVGKRHRRYSVVAWKPLPEPYKEGEQK